MLKRERPGFGSARATWRSAPAPAAPSPAPSRPHPRRAVAVVGEEFGSDPTHGPSPSSPRLPRRRRRGHPRRHVSPARALPPSPRPPPLLNRAPAPSLSTPSPHPLVRSVGGSAAAAAAAQLPFRGRLERGTFENKWSGVRVRVRALRLRDGEVTGANRGCGGAGAGVSQPDRAPAAPRDSLSGPRSAAADGRAAGRGDAANKVRQGSEVAAAPSATSPPPGPGAARRCAVRSCDLH